MAKKEDATPATPEAVQKQLDEARAAREKLDHPDGFEQTKQLGVRLAGMAAGLAVGARFGRNNPLTIGATASVGLVSADRYMNHQHQHKIEESDKTIVLLHDKLVEMGQQRTVS